MCRNIRTLHNFEPPAEGSEIHDAALQYVRKISGSTKPSQANAEVFERAGQEIAHATQNPPDGRLSPAPPQDPEGEGGKRPAGVRAEGGHAGTATRIDNRRALCTGNISVNVVPTPTVLSHTIVPP